MEKFNQRLLNQAEKIYKKYQAGLMFYQDAKNMIRELREKGHCEYTDQSLFEIECDLDDLFSQKRAV